MATDLHRLETTLAARAHAAGVEIRRGIAVEGVEQSDAHVSVRPDGETFRGLWLVGCYGGRSAVRRASGFAFDGIAPEFTGYSDALK